VDVVPLGLERHLSRLHGLLDLLGHGSKLPLDLGFDHLAVDDGLDLLGDHLSDSFYNDGRLLDHLGFNGGHFGLGRRDLSLGNLLLSTWDLMEDGRKFSLLDNLGSDLPLEVGLGHSVDFWDDHFPVDDILHLSSFLGENGFLNYRRKLSLFIEDLLSQTLSSVLLLSTLKRRRSILLLSKLLLSTLKRRCSKLLLSTLKRRRSKLLLLSLRKLAGER
jgi:hypothetical protein